MKKTVLLILFTSFFYSCQNDSNLIGNWYSTNGNYIVEFKFHQDGSIKYYGNYQEHSGIWKTKDSKIHIEFIESEIDMISKKITFDYKILGDSLFIKKLSEKVFSKPGFIKFENRFSQWKNYLGIKIDLKKSEKKLTTSIDGLLSKEMYIGFKNNKIVSRTQNRFINIKKDIPIIANEFITQKPSESKIEDLKFILIIDEKIPESKIDSIINTLKETLIKKIFRVYENDSIDYKNLNWHTEFLEAHNKIEWFGLYE
jgi:hypothetical protein|tara:strand:+ start:43 stop:810 length:768 start_codon:yes stop_codon:yes gene_type:complete